MIDLLKNYLVSNASPEINDMISQAYDSLEQHGAENLEFTFENLLMTDDVADTGSTLMGIIRIIKDLQEKCLQQYGVLLDVDTPIPDVTLILNAIEQLNDFEDTEAILRICLSEQQPDETLAEILSIMTHKTADDFLVYLESISASFIARIQDIVTATHDEFIPDEERMQRAKYVHRLNRFTHYINSKNLAVVGMLRDGFTVGYNYTTYANQVGRDFEGTIPEQIAKDMIAMALVSCDGSDNPRAVIKPCLEDFIADLTVITRVDIEVNRILQGFSYE